MATVIAHGPVAIHHPSPRNGLQQQPPHRLITAINSQGCFRLWTDNVGFFCRLCETTIRNGIACHPARRWLWSSPTFPSHLGVAVSLSPQCYETRSGHESGFYIMTPEYAAKLRST